MSLNPENKPLRQRKNIELAKKVNIMKCRSAGKKPFSRVMSPTYRKKDGNLKNDGKERDSRSIINKFLEGNS